MTDIWAGDSRNSDDQFNIGNKKGKRVEGVSRFLI